MKVVAFKNPHGTRSKRVFFCLSFMLCPMHAVNKSYSPFPKRPRQYAAEIIALPMRAQRARALNDVPEFYRAWVAELVSDYFAKRKFLNRRE